MLDVKQLNSYLLYVQRSWGRGGGSAMAMELGVSRNTYYRKLKTGNWTVEEINRIVEVSGIPLEFCITTSPKYQTGVMIR